MAGWSSEAHKAKRLDHQDGVTERQQNLSLDSSELLSSVLERHSSSL